MIMVNPIAMFVIFCLSLCIGQTLFASVLLLRRSTRERHIANHFLVVFMVAMCASASLFYLFDFWLMHVPHFMLSFMPLLPAIPVALYFYTAFQTDATLEVRWSSVLAHFSPCVIFLLVFTPFYTLEGVEKIEWFYFRHDPSVLKSAAQTYTYQALLLAKVALVFHGLVYCLLILKLLHKHNSAVVMEYSYSEGINFRWLKYLIVVLLSIYIVYPLASWSPAALIRPEYFWIGSVCMWSLLIAIFGYFGVNQQRIERGEAVAADVDATTSPIMPPDLEPRIEAQGHIAIVADLDEAMKNKKYYTNARLNVRELSRAVDIPVKQLSTALNSHLNMNFMEFVNNYRLEEAKQQLVNDIDKNVLDIAFDSGFNSKTAFYECFKKATRMTPTQFRKSALVERADEAMRLNKTEAPAIAER